MIKIINATVVSDTAVHLCFSDGSAGDYDLSALIARDTVMTRPRRDPEFVARCFLELGALCWPNGLELSAASLQRKLAEQGALVHSNATSRRELLQPSGQSARDGAVRLWELAGSGDSGRIPGAGLIDPGSGDPSLNSPTTPSSR